MMMEPKREVVCADAIPWLRERGVIAGACAVTSLPDVSEVGVTLEVWRAWFSDAVRLVVNAVPDESAALFFQSDIKRDGEWIDKGAMVIRAAQDAASAALAVGPGEEGGGGHGGGAQEAPEDVVRCEQDAEEERQGGE
jgi:hypothetical protein